MATVMKAIDLFCGCGGMSLGARAAGFDIIAGIDNNKKYISSFRENFGENQTINIDLTDITPESLMKNIGAEGEELDLLVGGPPCQGFSKNVPRKYRFLEDENNRLISRFIHFCEVLRPSMILMENVAEMKNGFEQRYTNEIIDRLTDCGYSISYAVLNAADYGIPQRRRRAFFLGSRSRITFPPPRLINQPPI